MYAEKRFDLPDKTAPYSAGGFLKFCESRDPQERYDWWSGKFCACAQYFNDAEWYRMNIEVRKREGIDLNMLAAGNEYPAYEKSWTFGLLAQRVRDAMAHPDVARYDFRDRMVKKPEPRWPSCACPPGTICERCDRIISE